MMREELELPSNNLEIQLISTALQAISHPTRLKILCFLGEQERIVNEILEHAGSTQSNISQHLEVLRKAGIVHSRRVHNKVYCSVRTAEMMPVIARIRELFCQQRDASVNNTFELVH